MTAYELIAKHYGSKRANRSGVLLINHIDEGLKILESIDASEVVKDAYCLHPLLQSNEDFNNNKEGVIPGNLVDAAILAMEYRRVANSYLSKDNIDDRVPISCNGVRQMLIADKVQNYKDFLIYHKDTHERSEELDIYFNNWFFLLGVDYQQTVKVIT